jgi:AraC-like DNA-binding protein
MSLTFTIRAAGPGQPEIVFEQDSLPKKYVRHLLPGGKNNWLYLGKSILIFQQFDTGKYQLLSCCLIISRPVKFIVRATITGTRVYLMLERNMLSRYRNAEWSTLKEGDYEVQYQPLIKKEIRLSPGMFRYLMIYWEEENTTGQVFPGKMPLQMLLSEYLWESALEKQQDPQGIVTDMVQQAIEKNVGGDLPYLTQDKIALIWQAAQNIKRFMDEPDVTQKQFRKTMLNKKLYNKGFQSIFGLTPKQYQNKLRMEEARTLIRDNPFMPLAEVSNRVGYNYLADFIAAYQKYFGYHPREENNRD